MTTANYAKAYKSWCNTQTVTVWLRRRVDEQQVEVANALRGAVSRTAVILASVELAGDEIVWNIPDAQLNPADNGREVRIGDTVVECTLSDFSQSLSDQVRWTVLSVEKASFGTRWRCVCRRER